MAHRNPSLTIAETRFEDGTTVKVYENTYSLRDFVFRVFAPSESFARILQADSGNDSCPAAGIKDIGQVSSALTALAKAQMGNLASQVENQLGCLTVALPVEDVPIEIKRLLFARKDEK